MRTPHRARGLLATAASLALLSASPAIASPAGDGLVITEVYGAGGNVGAVLNADFVELHNPTDDPIGLAGLSLQYRSAAGNPPSGVPPLALSGSVPAHGHYLIRMTAGLTGAALPTPDATGSFSMAAAGGQVILASTTAQITASGNLAGAADVVDMVGASGSTSFETAATTAAATASQSLNRAASGADTDSNAADFFLAAPTPTPSSATGEPGEPQQRTIAEIQGDDAAASPVAGATVATAGVVTAAYPSGGLNGFHLQTPGAPDTPAASDAIFVSGGPSGFATSPAVGDSVAVTGVVGELNALTQIAATTFTPIASLGTVTPKTAIPGTDCALPGSDCLAGAALDAARERHEGELFAPAGAWTVTDSFDGSPFPSTSSSFFGEIGLAANSTQPLVQPTALHDAQTEAAEIATRTRYNDAHRIVLDDGATTNHTTATGQPFPWLTPSNTVRVGAGVTFPKPVVLSYGFGTWRVLPQAPVTGAGADAVAFEQDRPAAPEPVGGDVRIATFNVLNFFPTTGAEFVGAGLGTCTFFNDRHGTPIANNQCNPNGPRGAATGASLERQRDKIVAAIAALDADVVSLEEIENSAHYGKPRDFAVQQLVDALNDDAGDGTWAFAPSPPAAELPAAEDVIRLAFIYRPARVNLVGASRVLVGSTAFANARQPLAQAFKAVGRPDDSAFAVIANHFKSKGSGVDDATGQGLANPDRVAQAQALVAFADDFAAARGIGRVFLAGDFNAYAHEDPIQVLADAGYERLASTSDPQETTYNFAGLAGSLDHVLANEAARADVTGVDIWPINANEPVHYEYSRFNSNVTSLYDDGPFRSSDHNPAIVGVDVPAPEPVQVQVLATNDFHGRLLNEPGSPTAGAAVLAGAVKQLRGENPNTIFAAAGDLIGASTFESFIDRDKPTIDVLNEAGLEVSSVGNHELDQGFDDLVDRVLSPTAPQGGARWTYLGANLRLAADGSPALAGTWTKELDGVTVGFVGTVTEDLPQLVSPAGISTIAVTDVVDETNAAADALKAAGADVVVALTHEGAPSADCATIAGDPESAFGRIVTGVNDNVDAIVSAHTHLAYNCSLPVAGWSGRPVTERPVVSAGQYAANLNRLRFDVDPASGAVTAKSQQLLKLKDANAGPFNYPEDAATKAIVDAAVANAEALGAQVLGRIAGPFHRAQLSTGSENRGGESTLGNLVAEVHRWSTRSAERGAAQIAFMNPGGLRADLVGVAGPLPRELTYRQAATVQPFANTLVNMRLTGAQIEQALEQQWQPAGASRPFLKLGISKGFSYTYDDAQPAGSRITSMRLDGAAVGPDETYSVTVNSFLAAGGDSFGAFAAGTGARDTGTTDLVAMVDYLAALASGDSPPLAVDYGQRAVGVRFPAGAPATYDPGATVRFDLTSLSMSSATDLRDETVSVALGDAQLGAFPVTTSVGTAVLDEIGSATVAVALPATATAGPAALTIAGATTGTTVSVPIAIARSQTIAASDRTVVWGQPAALAVDVAGNAGPPTGTVEIRDGATTLAQAPVGAAGTATVTLAPRALDPGARTLTAVYLGDDVYDELRTTLGLTVEQAAATVSARDAAADAGSDGSVEVTVATAAGVTPTGTVRVLDDGAPVGSATLVGGAATVAIDSSALAAGTYALTAVYDGSPFLLPAATELTYTVRGAPAPPPVPPLTPPPLPGPPATSPPIGGQSARPCVGDRRVTVTLRPRSRGQRLRSGSLTFRGRTVKLRKRGRDLVGTVDLRGLREGRYTVRLRGRTTSGRTVTETRRLASCIRRR